MKKDINKTILVTSDIHFEKLNLTKLDDYISYVVESINQVAPDMFIIAGDTTDNRNLQAGSFEYLQLQQFLLSIEDACSKIGTAFIILKGTPAHDGNILKNVTNSILKQTLYIEDICVKKIKGVDVLFIPQTYFINLEAFEEKVKYVVGGNKPTFCVFHGMFDFAVPMVYQTDSQFQLARDVCMRKEFILSQVTHFAVGGHVHEFIKNGDVFYDGSFCNREGVPASDPKHYGIKKIIIHGDTYNIHPIYNPHLEDVNEVVYEINEDSDIEKIIGNAVKFDTINTVFILVTDMSLKANQSVLQFKTAIKPVYMKRKVRADIAKDTRKYLTSIIGIDDNQRNDSEELLVSMYEKKYKSELPQTHLNKIVGTAT